MKALRRFKSALCSSAAAVCALSSCGTNGSAPPAAPGVAASIATSIATQAATPMAIIDPATGATIRGVVRFHGHAPRMPLIDMSSNPQCERQHPKGAAKEETVIVNANGTLRNTLVWLKSGVPRARWETPGMPVTLDQKGCTYRPHVVAVMVNQELEILNSDPVNHDVHAEPVINAAFNVAEPPRAESLHKRFAREEVWFPITCSVHPWMRTYVAVVSHPFFAVTGWDGSFTIKGVPPGEYTLEAVHEQYGRKQLQIKLKTHQMASADFLYAR